MNKTNSFVFIFSISILSGCKSTTGLEAFGFPAPKQAESTSTGTKALIAGTGCVAGGAGGYLLTKWYRKKVEGTKDAISDKEFKEAAAVVAGYGCLIGGNAGLSIIENMDEASKAEQEKAWQLALAQSEELRNEQPEIAWRSETHEGTVSIIDPITTADGQECATRRNYVTNGDGEVDQFTVVCKNSAGVYEERNA